MKIFIILSIVIILLINCVVESKRSFAIGRSRLKSGVPSVRRKSSSMNVDSIPHDSSLNSNAKPIGWNVNGGGGGAAAASGLIGPPPPYPGLGRSHSSSNVNIAPPAYSPNSNLPPSYSSVYGVGGNHHQSYGSNYGYGGGGTSNIGKIPPRGTPLNIDTTSFHGLGTGHSASGAPSYANALYNRYGSYGGGYGYGNHHSSRPFSFGSILTGLAAWNLARGFNSYNTGPQHVYIHKQNNDSKEEQQNFDMNSTNTKMIPLSTTTKYSSDINNNNNHNTTNSVLCLNSTCGNDKFYIDELNNGENITGKPVANSTII